MAHRRHDSQAAGAVNNSKARIGGATIARGQRLWIGGLDLRCGERFGAMHDLFCVQVFNVRFGQAEYVGKNVGRVIPDRRSAAPDPPGVSDIFGTTP